MRLIRANETEKVLKNERFIAAVDHLISHKHVNGQKELCEIIKVAESTLSNVRSKKKMVSDKTIYKMLDKFPGIFNIEWFQLKPICMLIEDYKKNPDENSRSEKPVQKLSEPTAEYQAIPKWADSIIQLVTEQVKTIESLRREVAILTEEINQLKK